MRVILADDVLLVRRGIADVLRDRAVEVVAETGDAVGLRDLVDEFRPDAVVLDIRMPPTHTVEGLVAAEQLRSEFPDVAVLLLSQYLESGYAVRLLGEGTGSVGYLIKEHVFEPHILTDALDRVCAGETVVDPAIVAQLVGRLRRDDPLDSLTAREREVLGFIAEGFSNRAIAQRLFVTERTVEAHTSNIFSKLHLNTSTDHHRRVLAVLAYLRA
jgi:DNA-binding NarL/FixJ family response regulator